MKQILTPEDFIKQFASLNGIGLSVLLGKSRLSSLVNLRAKLVRILRDDWYMSFKNIGKLINRDTTTVQWLYTREDKVIFKVPSSKRIRKVLV